MPNKKIIIIIGISLIFMAGLMYIMGDSKRHSWREHYRADSGDPYGTSIIYGLLEEYFPEEGLENINDSLTIQLNKKEKTGSYFYLGPALWIDSLRLNALLNFVERGNDAFIISPLVSFELLDTISGENCIDLTYDRDSFYYTEDEYFFGDSIATLNFPHEDLNKVSGYEFNYRYRADDQYFEWGYMPPDLFCEYQHEFTSLGIINDTLVNFARAKYGKGNFYFHTTSLAFTNFHIVKKEGREYVEKVLLHLEKGPILWDKTTRSFELPGQGNRGFGNSPLKYILSQPSLAWGWYILLGLAVLYLIFRAKRRQRIIPVLEQNENTSLEFINTIGRLHFIQNNHRQLALQKMKLFLGFIREHYKLSTKDLNEQFKKQLSVKSEIPLSVIEKIFSIHGNIERSKFTSENTLATFHRKMEGFYLKCK